MNAAVETQVDARNPWLGLASFTEETRAWFFGRDEEVAELSRRVQRKLLTVLFGQSGLGKTSILRAGLVPKLRAQGYCPVYVRIGYAAGAPAPAEQIKHAIAQTALASGTWTRTGVAEAGESLWEFLHHRDDVLRDESGQNLIPLLIFDQFEEIFTLAQNDAAGRARAARFIQDLGDLVENRPPQAFEQRLETDDSAAEKFDFARSDYRVLIALREDYLAPLESLKREMPSIAQNRVRLAPMTGQQALAAVVKPGKGLVNDEVAAAIVRFVAGGSELQNAEVEPALLSLVCRELNDARITAGRAEISPDLLEGSQDSILSNFYERSLSDQPAAVRRIIEDQLLTVSGFRENIAEERLTAAFKAAGAAPNTLAVLVNRRLLRVEERLDLRRVELTHDVLCSVVKRSRDVRQEREAREASDRLLVEQREREVSARAQLVRARKVASICIVLAIAAIVAAVIAVVSTQRARRAEQATQQARVQAEALLGYLSDDFAGQLETFGQLATSSAMARRQIDYFQGLPPSLKDADSVRYGALAMINYAEAEQSLGHVDTARPSVNEAIALLEKSRAAGDHSEATTIALARAYDSLARIQAITAEPAVMATAKKAQQLIETVAGGPRPTAAALKAAAQILIHLGFEQKSFDAELAAANSNLQRARDIAAALGAKTFADPQISALYAEAGCWQSEVLIHLGRVDEARVVDTEASSIALKVLESRPDYRSALHSAEVINIDLAILAWDRLDPAAGLINVQIALKPGLELLRRDPTSTSARNNAIVSYLAGSDLYWAMGRVDDSLDYTRQAYAISAGKLPKAAWYILNALSGSVDLLQRMADSGHGDISKSRRSELFARADELRKSAPADSSLPAFISCAENAIDAYIALSSNDFKTAAIDAAAAHRLGHEAKVDASMERPLKFQCDFFAPLLEARAQLWLGNYAAAEAAVRKGLEVRDQYPADDPSEKRDIQNARALNALTVARQGRTAEARALIEPVVQFERDLSAHNKGDVTQRLELAVALYAQSLTDPSRQAALRHEALSIFERFPPGFLKLHSVTRWRQLIQSGK
jgi:hypothetical protein